MAHKEALFDAVFASSYRLPNPIPAIQIFNVHDGAPELGAISHLPEGAELTFCGDGFNEATVKARCEGQFYYVFLEDFASSSVSAQVDASANVSTLPRRQPGKHRAAKALTAYHVA